MKILMATESYYPNISGVAVFSHNLAKKMVERGHEVYVIAPSPTFRAYAENIDGVKIYRLASKLNKFRQGYYISKRPDKAVKEIFSKIAPDIVHLQDPALISLSTMLKARKTQVPIVVTNHFSLEYVVSYLPKIKLFHPLILLALRTYLNWFYNQCQILTCPTATIARQFKGPITRVKLKVVSNGVDVSRFMPYYGDRAQTRGYYRIPLDKTIILSVGRLDVDKKVDVLISAAELIKNPKWHFVIVGEGKEKEHLKNLARKLGVWAKITFIDFIPHENKMLPRIYQIASLFVNPCPMETQSIVTLEAQATGLPLVVANAGALPELVKNNQNGYSFKTGEATDLAKKISMVLSNKARAKKMGQMSLEMVEKHFVDRTYDQFENIYSQLGGKNG